MCRGDKLRKIDIYYGERSGFTTMPTIRSWMTKPIAYLTLRCGVWDVEFVCWEVEYKIVYFDLLNQITYQFLEDIDFETGCDHS